MDELTVSVEKIEKILQKARKMGVKEVSFSFVIGSLFPDAYKNMKQSLVKERIDGYNQAKKEFENKLKKQKKRGKNENQRLN